MSLELLLQGVLLGTATIPETELEKYRDILLQGTDQSTSTAWPGPPINLKLDTQGADINILSALSSSRLASVPLLLASSAGFSGALGSYRNRTARSLWATISGPAIAT